MRISRVNCRIYAQPGSFFLLAAMLLLFPLQWVAAFLVSSVFHEFCHILALCILGCGVERIDLDLSGAKIETPPMEAWKEALCALAGPVGALGFVFLGRWFPRLAICAALQSLYNLLPVYPLDGGRALRCLVQFPWGHTLCGIIEMVTLVAVCCVGIYGSFVLRLGLLPVGAAGLMTVRALAEKFLAKKHVKGYNRPTM